MRELGVPGLVGRAQRIVVGSVERTESRWTEDGRYIVTDSYLRVSQTIHGEASPTIRIRRLGGTVDGIGMRVAGVVELRPGDHVMVFAEQRRGHWWVVGMQQGAYRLRKDARGQMRVYRRLGGLALMPSRAAGGGSTVSRRPAALDEREPLIGNFIQQVQDTIRACAQDRQLCR